MTAIRSTQLLFLPLLLIGVIRVTGQTVPTLSYDEAQQRAIQAQKPFLLICGTATCPYTRKTLDEVLLYPPLYYYIQDNFVAGFMDMNRPENRVMMYNYGLPPSTPTFLVFNQSGRLNFRYDTFMTPEQMYDSLIVVAEGREPGGRIQFNTRAPEETIIYDESEFERPAAPMPLEATLAAEEKSIAPLQTMRMAAPSSALSIAGALETAITVSEPRLPATQTRDASSLLAGLEAYSISNLTPTLTYGLVYDRFTSRKAVDSALTYLREVWLSIDVRKNDVWVYLTPDTRTPEYTVVLGTFESEEQANMWANLFRPIVDSELTPVDLATIQP